MNEVKNNREAYASPSFRKLTPEQAKRFLEGHAHNGDPAGAMDLLELLEQELEERVRFLEEDTA